MSRLITLVAPYAKPERGACPSRTHRLAEFLIRQGHRVKILAPQRPEITGSPEVQRYSSKQALFHLIDSKTDLVWATTPPMTDSLLAAIKAKWHRIPFVLDIRDPWVYSARAVQQYSFFHPKLLFYSFIQWLCCLLADRIFVVTPGIQTQITKELPFTKKKLRVIPNGSTVSQFKLDLLAREKIRKQWNLKKNSVVALYAGAFIYWDFEKLLKSILPLLKEQVLVVAILVPLTQPSKEAHLSRTKTTEYVRLHAFAQQQGIIEQFRFIDGSQVSDEFLADFFSAADIGIVPIHEDLPYSIPIKVYDYWTNGLTVVAKGPFGSDLQALQSNPLLGYYTSDWEQFEQTMRKLLSKPPFDLKQRERIQAFAAKHFERSQANRLALLEFENLWKNQRAPTRRAKNLPPE